MKKILICLALTGICPAAGAAEISSVYTDLDVGKDCTIFSAAGEGDGDWANMVCNGYRGYPVVIYSADLRQSMFYGFPPAGDLAPAWESFAAFNTTAAKIEWRLETQGGRAVPFAVIQRWFVSDPEDADKKTEVLVVAKVGQIAERDGCVVGLVVATGNPKANETARKIPMSRFRPLSAAPTSGSWSAATWRCRNFPAPIRSVDIQVMPACKWRLSPLPVLTDPNVRCARRPRATPKSTIFDSA